MDPLLNHARHHQPEMIALLHEMVECESPSDDPAAVNRFVALLADNLNGATIKTYPGGRFGKHLRAEFKPIAPRRKPGDSQSPSDSSQGQILVLGHSDTVWPLGTLASMPFRQSQGRLWGPGVFDMKAGLAFFIFAMRAIRELQIEIPRKIVLQVNSDEEVGSESSRPLTEEAARSSVAVLVVEPGTGLEGKLKTARKGVGDYTIVVRGRATHAGVDFQGGASAILEMGRQLERIASFTRLGRGITVSPGVIRGGTRSNVIPVECTAEIDIRIPRAADATYLARRFASLKPFDKRCTIEVTGGVNRPPMERSPGVRRLFRLAHKYAADLGINLEESSTGGGSDGNFTAALGVPTLDGLGAVGEGAHAPNESILINRIADRTALLAKLLASPDLGKLNARYSPIP